MQNIIIGLLIGVLGTIGFQHLETFQPVVNVVRSFTG